MAGRKLGDAYVEVGSDVKGFGTGLGARLRAELRRADSDAKSAGRRIGRLMADSIGDELVKRAPAIRAKLNAALRSIRVTVPIRVDVDTRVDNSSIDRLMARVRGRVAAGATSGVSKLPGFGLGSLGSLAKGSKGGLLLASLLPSAGAAGVGAFHAIGTELLNVVKLSGFLPAGLAAAGAAAISAKVAFLGMGDALDAVFARDTEKLTAAIQGLGPSAREFVFEVMRALPVLDKIRANAQESMFAPLLGVVTKIVTALGPTLTVGIGRVAASLASIIRPIGELFASEKVRSFLDNLFESTANIIGVLGPPITRLISAFVSMANAGLPGLAAAGTGLANLIDVLAQWLEDAVASGKFLEWLESAKRTFGDVMFVVIELMALFGVLFDDANTEGDSFLRTLGELIIALRVFAESPDGKRAFQGLADMARMAGYMIVGVAGAIWLMITAVGAFINAIRSALEWIGILDKKKASVTTSRSYITHVESNADGGIITSPILSTLAEDGPEVVIPLTRPGRARKLAEDSGLTKMFQGNGGNTTQVFYLGGEQIEARLVRVYETLTGAAVGSAAYGTRAA